MNSNNRSKVQTNYIPYGGNLEDIIYPLNEYFYTYGIKKNKNGVKEMDSNYIVISKLQIIVKCSFFKHDRDLLEGLYELPIEGREEILLNVIQAYQDMITKTYINLRDRQVVLIDDADYKI